MRPVSTPSAMRLRSAGCVAWLGGVRHPHTRHVSVGAPHCENNPSTAATARGISHAEYSIQALIELLSGSRYVHDWPDFRHSGRPGPADPRRPPPQLPPLPPPPPPPPPPAASLASCVTQYCLHLQRVIAAHQSGRGSLQSCYSSAGRAAY